MYLIVSQIPIHVRDGKTFTDISWQRDLLLARDWLAPSFGQLTVLSPFLTAGKVQSDLMHLTPIGTDDGIRIVTSFDVGGRVREFWTSGRKQWVKDVRRELASAKVVHSSASDVHRPMWYFAHMEAVKAGVMTVLVGPDMDPYLFRTGSLKERMAAAAFNLLLKRALPKADLALLKEGSVFKRYSGYCKNVQSFCQSMHPEKAVISNERLEARLATLNQGRPLKAVYAGRYDPRKGLLVSINAVAVAKKKGVRIEYDLFGTGAQEGELRKRVEELGLSDQVQFRGYLEYSPEFIGRLADYDMLLFLPTAEDTPRMLYDSMAAGLPLVGSAIYFLKHRVETDKMGVLVDIGRADQAGEQLCTLNGDRAKLAALSRLALEGGHRHSVDHWYQRRAQWTRDAAAARGRK